MSTKTNIALDAVIFVAFLAAANPRLTGISIHEWLSLAFAAAILIHLLFHWDWLERVTRDFFKKLFHQSRLNYAIDALFFIAATVCIFSGLMISREVLPALGIQISGVGRSWRMVHSTAADASVILLGIHLALHWKWMVGCVKRYVFVPAASLMKTPPLTDNLSTQPVRVEKDH